jgi:tight adherence protein B
MAGIFTPIIYVLAFVAVVMLAQLAAGLVFSRRDRNQRVNRRLTMLGQGMTREQVYSSLVRKEGSPASSLSNARWARLHDDVALYCRQGGLSWTPLRLVGTVAAAAAVLWLVALSMAGSGSGLSLVFNGAVSLFGAVSLSAIGVWLWVRRLRNRRLKQIEEQLPLALDIINRAIRAGHPVISAVQLASDELRDPLGSEFGIIVDETTYGMDFREALANFAHRTGSPDAHFFAVSIAIQSETGGNLAEILEGLASVMRGRHTLGKRVRSLASEGRASAMMLSVLPVGMVLFQLLINPRLYSSKFSDPVFWPIVGATGTVYLIGWLIVHRIINFKY